MAVWEIVVFILIVLSLVVAIWLLNRSEKKTKNKWKLAAYNLLEEKNPDPKKIKETVKFIRIYGGHFTKDPEFNQLDVLLCNLYREINKFDNINAPDFSEKKPRKTKK